METTHDEQVCEMFRIQANVGILKRTHESNGSLNIGQVNRLRIFSGTMEGLEKAFNHYPEVKTKLFISIKNLLNDQL